MHRLTCAVLVAVFLAAGSAAAHHAWPVSYSRLVTLEGTVTDYNWSNPHVMFGLDVKGSDGAAERWNVGGPSTSRMEGNGWDRTTLKAGDVLTASGYQFSDGSKILRLEKIVLAGGREMYLYGRRR